MKQPKSTAPLPEGKRSYVFLQGPTSLAFRELGHELASRGHRVTKVNFCPGDWLFWRGSDTVMYRGNPENWPDFVRELMIEVEATDIVYFADRFPYHKAAQRVAREQGVRAVSMEYGYLRPDWIILEEGGQSAYSHVPNAPEVISKVARDLPPADKGAMYHNDLNEEAFFEASFHLSNGFLGVLMPKYQPNRYYPELVEFPAYIPRLIRRSLNAKRADRVVKDLANEPAPCFLVPLQMQNDYQLRDNAPKGYQHGFVREVLASFRDHAPKNARLLFKLHPMDNGLENWRRKVRRWSREAGLADRVTFIDGGVLSEIFEQVEGAVLINSTTGLTALRSGLPVKTMGVAVYDVPGLTHQGTLESFWTEPTQPDHAFVGEFVRAIAESIHVRGTVYGKEGRAAFVENAAARLEGDEINLNGLYEAVPPRLSDAQALGIAVDWPLRFGDTDDTAGDP